MNICFRTDASADIGSGHLMRCLTLANGLAQGGSDIVFCMRDLPGNIAEKVQKAGFSHETITADLAQTQKTLSSFSTGGALFDDWLDDAEQTLAICSRYGSSLVVVDHYLLDARWEGFLRSHGLEVFVIDDLANRPHDCAYLLDQTLDRDPATYLSLVPSSCQLLLGADYCLIRPEFIEMRPASLARRAHSQLQSVLISMGGADKRGLSFYAAQALCEASLPQPLSISVVLGALSDAQKPLRDYIAKTGAEIHILQDVSNMAEIMHEHDLIINAGGGTNWERLALGMPSIITNVAANQNDIVAILCDKGLSVEVPNDNFKIFQESIVEILNRLQANPAEFQQFSARAGCVVDAGGLARLVDLLQK